MIRPELGHFNGGNPIGSREAGASDIVPAGIEFLLKTRLIFWRVEKRRIDCGVLCKTLKHPVR